MKKRGKREFQSFLILSFLTVLLAGALYAQKLPIPTKMPGTPAKESPATEVPGGQSPECTIIFYENVPTSLTHMMKRDGEYIAVRDVMTNKEKDNWNKPCNVKVTIATMDGTELETISQRIGGDKGQEYTALAGKQGTIKLGQPGKFKVVWTSEAANTVLLEQPFEVIQWDKNYLAIKGNWENLGALMVDSKENTVKFRFYLTTNSKAEAQKMEDAVKKIDYQLKVVLKYQGKPVATGMIKEDFRFEGTEQMDVDLMFEPAPGVSSPMKASNFEGKDGEWLAAVFMGNQVLRKFTFKVSGGKLVPHARQSADYSPKTNALNTLWPRLDTHGKGTEFIWMEHSGK